MAARAPRCCAPRCTNTVQSCKGIGCNTGQCGTSPCSTPSLPNALTGRQAGTHTRSAMHGRWPASCLRQVLAGHDAQARGQGLQQDGDQVAGHHHPDLRPAHGVPHARRQAGGHMAGRHMAGRHMAGTWQGRRALWGEATVLSPQPSSGKCGGWLRAALLCCPTSCLLRKLMACCLLPTPCLHPHRSPLPPPSSPPFLGASSPLPILPPSPWALPRRPPPTHPTRSQDFAPPPHPRMQGKTTCTAACSVA